jgi:hypothetical protein
MRATSCCQCGRVWDGGWALGDAKGNLLIPLLSADPFGNQTGVWRVRSSSSWRYVPPRRGGRPNGAQHRPEKTIQRKRHTANTQSASLACQVHRTKICHNSQGRPLGCRAPPPKDAKNGREDSKMAQRWPKHGSKQQTDDYQGKHTPKQVTVSPLKHNVGFNSGSAE